MLRNLRKLLVLLVIFTGGMGHANDLPVPSGPVLLEVTGGIAVTNADGRARFDREMLAGLDWREIETFTSFTDGPQRFAGPTLSSLLAAVGAQGQMMAARAINDYFVEIPLAHANAHDVLLAMEMNGRTMRLRDKGPIWVVYPLSEEEAERQPFDTEMIWQLNRIEILP